jgi:hypothetical protein
MKKRLKDRDSSVGIATVYRLDGNGSISISSKKLFFLPPALGSTQLSILWVLEALSLGVKRPVREADNSSLYSTNVKNFGFIPPLLHKSSWRGAYLI